MYWMFQAACLDWGSVVLIFLFSWDQNPQHWIFFTSSKGLKIKMLLDVENFAFLEYPILYESGVLQKELVLVLVHVYIMYHCFPLCTELWKCWMSTRDVSYYTRREVALYYFSLYILLLGACKMTENLRKLYIFLHICLLKYCKDVFLFFLFLVWSSIDVYVDRCLRSLSQSSPFC